MSAPTSSLPRVCLGRSPVGGPFRIGLLLLLLAGGIAGAQPDKPGSTARPAGGNELVVPGSMTPVFTLAGHLESLYSVRFSPDGRSLVTTSEDHTLILWDTATGRALRTFLGHDQTVFGVAFSPDGAQLASASGARSTGGQPARPGEVRLWEVATGRELGRLQGHAGIIYRVAFRNDGRQLASAGDDRLVKVWDVDTRTEVRTLQGHTAPVFDVAFSPDGKYVLSASGDFFNSKVAGEVKLWDAATGQEVRTFKGHQGPVYSLALSPDGQQLATASGDNTVKLWDVASGKEVRTLTGHKNSVYSVAFSPDGRCLASASADHTVRIWDLTLPAYPLVFTADPKGNFGLAYSPDGKRLASTGGEHTAKLWDVSALRGEGRTQKVWAGKDLEGLWNDLAAEEAPPVYRAFWTLLAMPDRAVPFLQERLRPVATDDPRAPGLIAGLDSDTFAAREKAMNELEQLAESAENALRRALDNPPSLEVQRRVEQLLLRIKERPVNSPEGKRVLRTIQLLESVGTPPARTVLERVGRGGWGKMASQEAHAALTRLDKRPHGKP